MQRPWSLLGQKPGIAWRPYLGEYIFQWEVRNVTTETRDHDLDSLRLQWFCAIHLAFLEGACTQVDYLLGNYNYSLKEIDKVHMRWSALPFLNDHANCC